MIDIALIAISLGKTYFAKGALKKLLQRNKFRIVRILSKTLKRILKSRAAKIISGAMAVTMTVFGTSLGDIIARALDYADGWWGYKRNNGYIFN